MALASEGLTQFFHSVCVTLACVFAIAFLILSHNYKPRTSGQMYQGRMKDTCAWTVHVQLCLCLRCEGHQLVVRKKTGHRGSVIWCLAFGHLMRAKSCRALRPTKPHFFLSQLQQTFSGSHSLSEAAGFPEQHCEHVIIVPYSCSREGDSAERNEFILVYSQD